MFLIQIIFYIIIFALLAVIFYQDFSKQIVNDFIVIPAILLGFIFNLILGYELLSLVIGMIIGGGFFLLQYILSKGKWVGAGDIRIGILMGALIGFPYVFLGLYIAYVLGLIIVLLILLFKIKKFKQRIAFGPMLVIGIIITMFFGKKIVGWYLGML